MWKYTSNLNSNGGTSYKWSVTGSSAVTGLYTTSAASTAYTAGASQNPMFAKPTTVTSYTVTVTDGNSCSATAAKSVNVYNALTAAATADPTTACSGDTSRLNVTSSMYLGYTATSISYSPIATPGSGVTTLCSGGTALVSVTNNLNNGYWNSIALPFTLSFNGSNYSTVGIGTNGVIGLGSLTNNTGFGNTLPSASAANPSFAPFYANLTAAATGTISYFTFGTAPNRKFVINYTAVPYTVGGAQTFQAIINEDGSFESHIAPYDATGSTGTVTASIALIQSGTVAYIGKNNLVNNTFSANEAWKFSLTPTTYTYNWSTPTAPTTINSTSVSNPKLSNFGGTETYVVSVTETTSGCSVTANATVSLSTTPLTLTSLTNSNPSFCHGDSSILTVLVSGGCQPYTYTWSGGLTTSASVKVKPTTTTPYSVTVTDKGGASVSATTTVTVNNPQPASTTSASRCGTGTLTLSATRSVAADSITWYSASTGGVVVGTGNNFVTPVLPSGTTTYYVSESNVVGVGSSTLGSVTSTTSSVGESPYYFYYGGQKTQYIIRAAELTALGILAGNITSVSFTVTSVGTSLDSFGIRMGNTLQSSGVSNSLITSNLTSVYFSQLQAITLGLNTYNFTTPFYWDGVSNVVLEVTHSSNNSGVTSSTVNYTSPGFVTTSAIYEDNNTYSAFLAASSTTTLGGLYPYSTTSSYRPVMDFNYQSYCSGTRVPVTAIVTPSSNFDVTAGSFVCPGDKKMLTTVVGAANYDQVVWSPITNLFTDAACLVPYVAGAHAYTVYAKPASSSNVLYTATATNTTTLCSNIDTTRLYTNNIVATSATPITVNFTGYTGADLSTVFPAWSEASGQPLPLGTTSSWTSITGLGGASNVTAKINLYSTGKKEWIVGPKFSVGSCSFLSFDAAISDYNSVSLADPSGMTGTDDSVNVMLSTDCGTTWANIYSFNKSNQPSFSLSNYSISLSAYSGMDVVIGFYATEGTVDDAPDYDFHLDNISIANRSPIDASVSAIVTPAAGSLACGNVSQPVTITLKNNACQTLTSIPVAVVISGPVSTTLSGTWTGSLVSGATTNYTVGSFNMSAGGTYTFVSTANAVGDTTVSNNSITTTAKSSSPNFTLALGATQICPPTTTTLSISGITGNDGVFNGTNSASVAIPDNSTTGVSSTINLVAPTGVVISSASVVKVTLNITHGWDSDLDLFLVDPSGTKALEVSTDNGSSSANYTNTILTTAVSNSITTGTAPFTGTFAPEGTLSTAPSYTNIPAASLIGAAVNGGWKLYAFDDASGFSGTINNWSLEIVTPSNYSYTVSGSNASPLSYSGAFNANAVSTLSPTASGINKYVVSMTNSSGCTYTDTAKLNVDCSTTWLGTTSTDWSNPSNWSFGVPNSCATNVVIPSGTPNPPTISTANYSVGDVSIASGVNLTLSGNNLLVCGDWNAGTGANAVTVGTGNVILQGSGAHAITGKTQFEKVTVNTSGTYTLSGDASINQILVPQSGTLTVTGSLTFLSTSATHCATIDLTPANTGALTGNVIAQRFVPVAGSNQHYVSSPVNTPSLSAQFGASGTAGFVVPTGTCDETVLASGSPYGTVFQYDESKGASCSLAGWKSLTSGAADNGRGYSVYLPGTTTTPWALTGTANMAATYPLAGLTNTGWTNSTLQGRSQSSGWSLVGNPYLSNLNLGGGHNGFDAQAQVWQTSGPYVGTYQPVIMGSGSAFVAPFQGFMVHKTTVGGAASFDLGRTECTNTTTTFFKTFASTDGTLTMKVNGNGFNDISTILFNTNATDHFDPQMDANKLPGKLTQPMIASKLGADLYSINNITSVANVPAVPVQFMPGTNGTYTITFDDIATFDPTVNIYLEDVKTGAVWQDLRKNNVYTFTSITSDIKDRFVVHFTLPASVETFDASCKTTGSMVVKQDGTPTWDVVVKDVNGQVKGQGSISQSNNLQLNNLEAGDYTVEFADANGHSAIKNVKVDGVNGVSVSYIANNITPYTNETVTFTSTANSAVTYAWDFGDGTTSTLANPTHVYTATGTYSVTLKATNVDGCDATIAQSITVSQDVTGINNPKSTNNGIVIYVNNGKNLNITFSGYHGEIADIQAFNLLGQEIVNVKHNTGTKFVQEIDQVEAAYVIVKVTVSGQATTKKVLITKE